MYAVYRSNIKVVKNKRQLSRKQEESRNRTVLMIRINPHPNRRNGINYDGNNELMLASVNGVAGRVGLFRGGIITHVN